MRRPYGSVSAAYAVAVLPLSRGVYGEGAGGRGAVAVLPSPQGRLFWGRGPAFHHREEDALENGSEITIRRENEVGEAGRELIARLSAELAALYGDDGAGRYRLEDARHPGAVFVTAWMDGRAVGCGALRSFEPGVGEVKRMYTDLAVRGRGVARSVLAELEAAAMELGYRRLRLETGARQPEAIRLYGAAGYHRIPCWPPYDAREDSLCFQKRLPPPPPDPALTREALEAVFGPRMLEHALFYGHDFALRFELSVGGTRTELFTQAHDRAREILAYLFRDSSRLTAILSWYGAGRLAGHLSVFHALRECGVRVPRPCQAWTTRLEGDDPDAEEWTVLAFSVDHETAGRLLWGALAADIGIRPRLLGRLHLADPERGVLAHPYDDRGMDVIGPNRAAIADLYGRFSHYLLDYDRGRMDAFFGGAAPGG